MRCEGNHMTAIAAMWVRTRAVGWIKIKSAAPEEVEQALRRLELQVRIVTACATPTSEPMPQGNRSRCYRDFH